MYLIFTWEMFNILVRWVDIPTDFANSSRPLPNFLLYPQTMRLEMAQLAKAGSRRDPDGGTGVRPYANGHLKSQVSEETLVTQSRARCLYKAVELSFAG